jgi:hypothetical protein
VAAVQPTQGPGIVVAGLAISHFTESYASYVNTFVPVAWIVQVVSAWLFMSLLAGWIVRDSTSRGKRRPYDFDTLMAFLWVPLTPLYLLKTRRWRGALIIVAAIVAAVLIDIAATSLADAAWEKLFS